MENQSNWEAVKEFYKEKFDLGGKLVELNANYTILLMCASGASNKSIAKFLDISEKSVGFVLNEVFPFDGWSKDLPFNPYKIYKQCKGDTERMTKMMLGDTLTLELIYKMCEVMERVDERLENEWV